MKHHARWLLVTVGLVVAGALACSSTEGGNGDGGGGGGSGGIRVGTGGAGDASPAGTGGAGLDAGDAGDAAGDAGDAADARDAADAGDAGAADVRSDGAGDAPAEVPMGSAKGPTWVLASGGDFGELVSLDIAAMDGDGVLTAKGRLTKPSFPGVMVPSYLVAGPKDKIYVADEHYGVSPGQVFAFSLDTKTGALSPMNAEAAAGQGTVFLSVVASGKWLLAANFGGASVQVFAIGADGKVGAASDTKVVGANPHAIYQDRSGKGVFVPCIGADKIYQFTFDDTTGKLSPSVPATLDLPAKAGPRHMSFPASRPATAYLINELTQTISRLQVNPNGTLALVGAPVSTVPEPVRAMIAARTIFARASAIVVHPSGKFLYETTRLDQDDMLKLALDGYLGVFPVNDDGSLGTPSFEKVGKEPRGFEISPDGNFLVIANQKSPTDNLVAYAIEPATGLVTRKSSLTLMNLPMMVAIVPATP